ncbi:hypothetical protein EDD22DRAFT_1019559 [Suillus occidentalis]|nr:hypothetical protein EDD22DRAFT_1019559 [Suillus occidentalis]
MSPFPIFHNLDNPASFPALSSYSAEQISLPLEQPLFNVHQKAADLAALDAISEDDLLAIVKFLFSSAPGAQSLPTGNPNILQESSSEFQNDFTAAVRTRLPHPRVAHACDHCRRRKTKGTVLWGTAKRRSRKPYDVSIPYRPRPCASAPTPPHIAAPRVTYPSVMLPNPTSFWSFEDGMSASQANTTSNAPFIKPPMQVPTVWSAPAQCDWQDVDFDVQSIPFSPSSCPSLWSDDSSRGSSPLGTPISATFTSASPLFFSSEETILNPDEIETSFDDLYQGLTSEWYSLSQRWPDETESIFAQ